MSFNFDDRIDDNTRIFNDCSDRTNHFNKGACGVIVAPASAKEDALPPMTESPLNVPGLAELPNVGMEDELPNAWVLLPVPASLNGPERGAGAVEIAGVARGDAVTFKEPTGSAPVFGVSILAIGLSSVLPPIRITASMALPALNIYHHKSVSPYLP